MKTMKLAAALIAALFLVTGCASGSPSSGGSSGVSTGLSKTGKKAGGDELDSALREISDYLNKRIKEGSKAVFLNIKSDWPDLSDYILSTLAENAVNDEVFSVVDRQQLDAIRSELNFQWSGEVSDASAQEIGQMLGAQSIVSGVISVIGSVYRIQVRSIAVQTASVQGQFSQNVDGKAPTVAALTKRVVPAGSAPSVASPAGGQKTQTAATASAGGSSGQQAQAAQPAAPAQPAKLANGTYTFRQRPQAYREGIPIEVWIYQIVVRGNYFLIYVGNAARGPAPNSYVLGFEGENILTNLDNPIRTWTARGTKENNRDLGNTIFSFQNVTGTRFSLENLTKGDQWFKGVFEEIDMSKALYEP